MSEYPFSAPLIFDSHAHYDDAKFDGIREEILNGISDNGVCGIINCGCDKASSEKSLALAEEYKFIYATVGIHPENIGDDTAADIEKLAHGNKCVAIGEIGLDYYWRDDNKQEQKRIFAEQLELANRLGLPVIVHDREAHADTLEMLKKYRPKGVVHAFSGSAEMAEEMLKLGMYIGIGGVLTFKNAKKLPEIAASLPADRILLETDAPYCAPVPHRGETNRSDYILFTAQRLAEIRDTSLEDILLTSKKNTENLFGI